MPDKDTKSNIIEDNKDNDNKKDSSDLENNKDVKLTGGHMERGYGRFGGRSFRNIK